MTLWYWTDDTRINSIEVIDVDGDSDVEIVTGGFFNDNVRDVAQLTTWSGVDLSYEDDTFWYWNEDTRINSILAANVDGDSDLEIVTGGYFFDDVCDTAQMGIWRGPDLSHENVKIWCWTGDTHINSVVIGNIDDDAYSEIITGGDFYDNTRTQAQTTIWEIN